MTNAHSPCQQARRSRRRRRRHGQSNAGGVGSTRRGVRSWRAWPTIAGYEAIHMIRKGQACWSAAGGKVGLLHRFIVGMLRIEA